MTKIHTDPIKKISMANKLRFLASATRVVHDQATLMEAAQLIDGLVEGLQTIAMRDTVLHPDVNEPDYQNAFEMCQVIAYETVKVATPEFCAGCEDHLREKYDWVILDKGKPLKR